jgi:hypothetical protein
MVDEIKNLSNEELFHEQSLEINIREKSLTDAQRIEIRRRYDLSVAIGMRAHKIKDEIKDIEIFSKHHATVLETFEFFLYVFFGGFLGIKFGTSGLANEFLAKYEWFLIVPLISFWFYTSSKNKKYDKAIDKLKSDFIDLEVQWKSCNPIYRLTEYIEKRKRNNIDASDRADFTLVAIGLRKSIIEHVDFQYTWA